MQCLPSLLLQLDRAPADAAILAYDAQPFARQLIDSITGQPERRLPYDPCTIYPATEVYTLVKNEYGVPDRRMLLSLRRALLPTPTPPHEQR